ncbi:MAG: prepilin-type N-terminal cleavage/methylation domain-containing protein [bacterium]
MHHRALKLQRNKQGFTLIELLLYIGISAAMLTIVISFLSVLMQSRIKNQTIAEVEQQGVQVLQLIDHTIRNAEGVIAPLSGTTDSILQLDVLDVSADPTIFDVSGGSIRITEGVGSPIVLTSPLVTITNMQFTNLSRTGTPGTIRISFTLSRVSVDGKSEYNYSKEFYGSMSIRR